MTPRPDAGHDDAPVRRRQLGEVGVASAADLAADLGLPLTTIAEALRRLERDGRARLTPEGLVGGEAGAAASEAVVA